MNRILVAIAIAVLSSSVAAAQQSKAKTKVEVKDGKTITVTGCVQRSTEGDGFVLTNVTGESGVMNSYHLVEVDNDDIDDHIGHRVEVTGKAADRDKGKVAVRTKTDKTESKSEIKGDLRGLPFLDVKSFKMLASVCP